MHNDDDFDMSMFEDDAQHFSKRRPPRPRPIPHLTPVNLQEDIKNIVNNIIIKPDISTLPDEHNLLSGKVDKIPGKQLTTNDFTTDHKDKLDNIGTIPSDLSELTDNEQLLDNKVDKVPNKQLSTHDFTDDHKNKLEDIRDDVNDVVTYLVDNVDRTGLIIGNIVDELPEDVNVGRIGIIAVNDVFTFYQMQEEGWVELKDNELKDLNMVLQAILGTEAEPNPLWAHGENAPEVKFQYSVNGESMWRNNYIDGDFWKRSSTDGGITWSDPIRIRGEAIRVGPCSNMGIRYEYDEGKIVINWVDPEDVILNKVILSQWQKTVLVKKEGSYPESPEDGEVIAQTSRDEDTRDYHKFNPYEDMDIEDGVQYYYKLFSMSEGRYWNEYEENQYPLEDTWS